MAVIGAVVAVVGVVLLEGAGGGVLGGMTLDAGTAPALGLGLDVTKVGGGGVMSGLVVWGGGMNGGRGDCGKAGFDGKAGTGPDVDAGTGPSPGPGAD